MNEVLAKIFTGAKKRIMSRMLVDFKRPKKKRKAEKLSLPSSFLHILQLNPSCTL